MTTPTREPEVPDYVTPYPNEPEASVKLRQFVVDGYDGTLGTAPGEGAMRIGGRVSDVAKYIDTLAATLSAVEAKYAALSSHLLQVDKALGGNDTTLTVETAERVMQRIAAVEAERDALRVQEQLSDAIVDECDSDITKLVQERAALRQQLAAAHEVTDEMVVSALIGFNGWPLDDTSLRSAMQFHVEANDTRAVAMREALRAALAPQREDA